MSELLIISSLAYGICTFIAIVAYLIAFPDWEYHWTWNNNGKFLIPYLISGIIALIFAFNNIQILN